MFVWVWVQLCVLSKQKAVNYALQTIDNGKADFMAMSLQQCNLVF